MKQSEREVSKGGCAYITVDAAYSAEREKDPTAAILSKTVRSDGFDHWSKFEGTTGRC